HDQACWTPPRTVVFAGTTGGDCPHAADRTCGHINFFTSAQAARTWAHANPTVTGMVLRQAQAMRRGVAEFGAFMRAGTAPVGPDETCPRQGPAGPRGAHLSFGHEPRYRIGAPLARIELQTVFSQLIRRFLGMRWPRTRRAHARHRRAHQWPGPGP